jgi:hypothetical protein
MKLAAITMVYNEPDYMDIWCRHYARQVGAENCYVIDHVSDDGTTDGLGDVNVTRLARSPFARARSTSPPRSASSADGAGFRPPCAARDDPRAGALVAWFPLRRDAAGLRAPVSVSSALFRHRARLASSSQDAVDALGDLHAGRHQRWPDGTWIDMVNGISTLPRSDGDLDTDREPLSPLLQKLVESQAGREGHTYNFDLTIQGPTLTPLPKRFKGRF